MARTGFTSGADGTMPQIVKTDDVLGGDPRIEDHRIGVYQIYQRYVEGDETPEEIATSYAISVAEVHAALACALNKYEVDVVNESCTCPDWQQRSPEGGCKHLRRVDHEIKRGRVPRPDGRLPMFTG